MKITTAIFAAAAILLPVSVQAEPKATKNVVEIAVGAEDFSTLVAAVKAAGLATEVARLKARFVIKDGDKADD